MNSEGGHTPVIHGRDALVTRIFTDATEKYGSQLSVRIRDIRVNLCPKEFYFSAMVSRMICYLVFACGLALAVERGEEVRLWPNGAPGSEGESAPEVSQASDNPK